MDAAITRGVGQAAQEQPVQDVIEAFRNAEKLAAIAREHQERESRGITQATEASVRLSFKGGMADALVWGAFGFLAGEFFRRHDD